MRVVLALATVYLVWGSTYLAIRFAIETLPPLLMAGTRFLVAGALLFLWARLRGAVVQPRHWAAAAAVGGLLLFGGNGMVVLAQRHVPSGLAGLMIAITPLWMVLFDWALGGPRPTGRVVAGIAIGFTGMAFLVDPTAGAIHLGGAGMLVIATLSWAAGSMLSRRLALPSSPLASTAMQMLAGGAMLVLASLVSGDTARVDLAAASTRSLAAFAYLVVFGSLVAFSAYIWLLRTTTPAVVATYAYVNPVVAMALGWLVAGEAFTSRMLAASCVILAAVVIITTAPRPATQV
jgi:drug/metabolite transporter (DMT)-like permease